VSAGAAPGLVQVEDRAKARIARRAALLALLALGWGGAAPALAQRTDQLRREVAAIGIEERLGSRLPSGATFTTSEGLPLRLGDLAGAPLLLSFNYTSCPRLCGLQLAGIARGLRDMGWNGSGFSVLTVSIDPAEQLAQLARHKQVAVRDAGEGPGVERAWRFARGGPAEVAALAEAAGFRYRYDPRTGEFAHQATLVVIGSDGRISSYLHGIRYQPEALRAALARAAAGQVLTAAEQRGLGGYLLSCMGFAPADPAPRAMKAMRAGGVAVVIFLLGFVGWLAARDLRRRRAVSHETR